MRSYSRWVRHFITCIGCCLVLSVSLPVMAEKTYELKFATLAPVGSTWSDLLQEWADEVKARSDGRLIFKIYPGGVQGDEPDVLKKIRFGQLHGGAFTGYGIGHIYSPARALELPFLYNDIDEIDFVRERFMEEIEQGYRDNGYEMLGWMEVGFIYFFSREPIRSLDDLQERRIWHWQGDPIGKAFFDASGIAPVPLSIIDVYTSLSTGLIDTVYCPPLGAIALQWFTKARYLTDLPITYVIGTTVLSTKAFAKMNPGDQKIVREVMGRANQLLDETSRSDNQEAREALAAQGVEFVEPPDETRAKWDEIAARATEKLISERGYDPATLAEIDGLLEAYRTGEAAGPSGD